MDGFTEIEPSIELAVHLPPIEMSSSPAVVLGTYCS